jgi:hypothetical protein
MSRPHAAECSYCHEAFMESDCIQFPRICPKCKIEREKIPNEYKCSRCKGDLRETAKKHGCECIKSHPISGNKSGGQFMRTVIDYKGAE